MTRPTGPSLTRQARQELTPQPTVLETVALPIELLAYEASAGNYTRQTQCGKNYLVSLCVVCLPQRGQYFCNSIRPESFLRFFSVV